MSGHVLRRLATGAWKRLNPTPAERAWHRIVREADRHPRRTPGRLTLLDLDLAFPDAHSLAPQWHDIFVRETLAFTPRTDRPRILDCGANVGLASLWLHRAYPGSRITAFEADPAIADMLAGNLARNGAGDVEVVSAAAWTCTGRVAFRREGTDSGAVDVVAADTPGPVSEVDAVRLRDWIAGDHIDLLKLDVEGAEAVLLQDLGDQLDRVDALQVEVHDFEPARRILPACLDALTAAGWLYALDDFHVAHWRGDTAPVGPFRRAGRGWVVLVRAWRSVS